MVKNISKIVDIEDPVEPDETLEEDDELSNKTFVNPSQVDTIHSETIFKCEKCDFEVATNSF